MTSFYQVVAGTALEVCRPALRRDTCRRGLSAQDRLPTGICCCSSSTASWHQFMSAQAQ